MGEQLDDESFLAYCDRMTGTPRCGFVPEHVVRLLDLARAPAEVIVGWRQRPHGVYSLDRDQVASLVRQARTTA